MDRHLSVAFTKVIETAICCNTGWFRLIKDTSKGDNPAERGQPEFYMRVYRMKLDGEWCNTYMKFVYHTANKWADFRISHKLLNENTPVSDKERACRVMLHSVQKTQTPDNSDTIFVEGVDSGIKG